MVRSLPFDQSLCTWTTINRNDIIVVLWSQMLIFWLLQRAALPHNGKSTGLTLSIYGLVGQYRRFAQCSYLLCWCRLTDLNRWPFAYKTTALPTELNRQFGGEWWSRTTRVAMTVDLQSTPLPLRTNSTKLAMVGGFEPPTSWLTANCSTAELHHQFSTASIYYSTVPIATV